MSEKTITSHKKKQIFITSAVILVIVLVGLVVIVGGKIRKMHSSPTASVPATNGVSESSNQTNNAPADSDQLFGSIKDYFKADGAVDTAKVKEVKDQIPAQFVSHLAGRLDPLIDSALRKGDITDKQAEELRVAFGI